MFIPRGDAVEFGRGSNVISTWLTGGVNVGTTWGERGESMGTTWGERGDHVGKTWGERGDDAGTLGWVQRGRSTCLPRGE